MSELSVEDYEDLPKQPHFADVLKSLKAFDGKYPEATITTGLSGITAEQHDQLRSIWKTIPSNHRRTLVRELALISETDFMMDYRRFGLFALDDDDPAVREAAVDMLWIDSSTEAMNHLMQLADKDPSNSVRAAAVSGLGRFIYQGEFEEIPQDAFEKVKQTVVAIWSNQQETTEVRRRALEAIANCSHEIVPSAIKYAYESGDHLLQVSAIFAMGRSCDSQWGDIILDEITSDDAELRFEAVRASGEITLEEAVPELILIAVDEDDREIQEMAIWSLGEIGGQESVRVLNLLLETAEERDDEGLVEAVEEAIANASLVNGDLFILSGDDDFSE